MVAADPEGGEHGQAGDVQVGMVTLKQSVESLDFEIIMIPYLENGSKLIEAARTSCDAALFDTEGVVVGFETDIEHLTVSRNRVNAQEGCLFGVINSRNVLCRFILAQNCYYLPSVS